MKNIGMILAVALALASCSGGKDRDSYTENERAEKATWDAFLLGSWMYDDDKADVDYSKGVETFYSDGSYMNQTQNAKKENVVLNGSWVLDCDSDFTVNVFVDSLYNANEKKEFKEQHTYVVLSLEPRVEMKYNVDEQYREAQFLK
ncbi:MAG: hypothetical protein IK092_03285 [Muribaculaceae bacterium]|nr:hypothetical protein [Muribaculaceae bacterium]